MPKKSEDCEENEQIIEGKDGKVEIDAVIINEKEELRNNEELPMDHWGAWMVLATGEKFVSKCFYCNK